MPLKLSILPAPVIADNETELPAQKLVGPLAETVTFGDGFTVTTIAADEAEQPDAFVTVTE